MVLIYADITISQMLVLFASAYETTTINNMAILNILVHGVLMYAWDGVNISLYAAPIFLGAVCGHVSVYQRKSPGSVTKQITIAFAVTLAYFAVAFPVGYDLLEMLDIYIDVVPLLTVAYGIFGFYILFFAVDVAILLARAHPTGDSIVQKYLLVVSVAAPIYLMRWDDFFIGIISMWEFRYTDLIFFVASTLAYMRYAKRQGAKKSE